MSHLPTSYIGLEVRPDLWASIMHLEIYVETRLPVPGAQDSCREMTIAFFKHAAKLPPLEFFDEHVAAITKAVEGAVWIDPGIRAGGFTLLDVVRRELDDWRAISE